MIKHVVAFRFKDDVDDVARQSILDEVSAFPSHYPQMHNFTLGTNISSREQRMTHAFMIEFADEASLMEYLGSERHETFVRERWRPVIESQSIAALDVDGLPAGLEKELSVRRPRGPYGFAFARIAVPDLAASIDFYTYHVGLQLEGHDDTYAQLRANLSHHDIELVADPSLTEHHVETLAFTVESQEVLEDLRNRLVADGREIGELHPRTKAACLDGFSVQDPNGQMLEFVRDFHVYAEPPLVEWRPIDIVHPFLSTPHYQESLRFYCDVLGFLRSDVIVADGFGASTFLRCEDRYHHALALRQDTKYYVAHLAFQMKSLDHVMRGRTKAVYKKVPIPSDIVNHSASASIAFYMYVAQHGPRIELMDRHRVFTPEEHETHKERYMSADPRNIDVWRAAADDWERF
ncbi:MAG: VOC family protein [Candidatus Nanopelagicales bacterium]|nr:VOC family protein [Candidatus Nanopelagicales bacterium]